MQSQIGNNYRENDYHPHDLKKFSENAGWQIMTDSRAGTGRDV